MKRGNSHRRKVGRKRLDEALQFAEQTFTNDLDDSSSRDRNVAKVNKGNSNKSMETVNQIEVTIPNNRKRKPSGKTSKLGKSKKQCKAMLELVRDNEEVDEEVILRPSRMRSGTAKEPSRDVNNSQSRKLKNT